MTGSGSAANPYTISTEVACEDVRGCLSAGPGITYDQATGVIGTQVSGQAGNNLTLGPDGLYVPTGAATVNVGCGLSGDGSGGAPLTLNTGAWPYPCPPESAGGVIVCDANGQLRGEPRGQINYLETAETRLYSDLTVPTGSSVVPVDAFSLDVTNPDPCRAATVIIEREVDVSFNLPAGAGAAYGADSDEMWYLRNTGTSGMTNVHSQSTKIFRSIAALGPGSGATVTVTVEVGRGSGGATYNRIQVLIRAILISL